jgi:hypothetical protein
MKQTDQLLGNFTENARFIDRKRTIFLQKSEKARFVAENERFVNRKRTVFNRKRTVYYRTHGFSH